ncbi:MAG: sigma-70 family RNA polymerase sigma factor [Acidobacteriota bacterium]
MRTFDRSRGMLGAVKREQEDAVLSEEALIERARQGDQEAFGSLMQSHLPRVWASVWRILRHREDCEDVVQEVFLSAFRAISGFRGESTLSTWLHRIATTRALNHVDRAAEKIRRASRELDESGSNPAAIPASTAATPLQVLEARELRMRLAECLQQMPAAWRAVLSLRDVESQAYEEISRHLGIALGTVRSRLARARISLRQCIQGETS